jgi:hypothetical protein
VVHKEQLEQQVLEVEVKEEMQLELLHHQELMD